VAKKRAKMVWFDEAARRFNVSPDTLREWILEGRFPSPRGDGNRLFYTEAELDSIVEHGFLGRWKPAGETAGKSRKEQGKGGKGQDSEGTVGEAR
jgi:hypothetical protein